MKQTRVYKSFLSRQPSRKSFFLTSPWSLAKLVKSYLGIVVHLRLTVPKQMVLLREQYAESRRERLQCCCNPTWMKSGGHCYLRKRFGSMVEYHPISAKDQSRLHQFGERVLPGFFPGYVLECGGGGGGGGGSNWHGVIVVADIEELENLDASEIHARRLNEKGCFPGGIWNSQVVWQSSGFPKIPPQFGTTVHEAKSTTMFLKESRTGLNHWRR